MILEDFFKKYRDALFLSERAMAKVKNIEDRATVVFSAQFIAAGDIPAAKAVHFARASDEHCAIMTELAKAREEAADAKAEAELLKTRFDAWRTDQATNRAKMQQGDGR